MAGMPRQSAFMPTIKCSNCGNQVEISMMGEHICKATGPPAEPLPPPPMPDLLGGAFSSFKQNVFDKLTRAAPPNVDTAAANLANARSDQITPISASTGSQAISPKTPNGRLGPGPNGEDYFGPAIAESPPLAQSRRPGGYGGLPDPEGPESDSQFGTSLPKQPPSLLTRMNSIAPGPFEMNRRPSANALSVNGFQSSRRGSGEDDGRRPSTASSISSSGVGPPRMPRKNGYGGFGPPQKNGDDFEPPPLSMGKRSETFPNPKPNTMDELLPARTPSAPGPRQDRLRSTSSNVGEGERSLRPSYSIRDTSRPPPPRKSLMRPQTREGNPATSINLAAEFGANNPYHSPSISQSSSNSGYSQHSSQPSQTSSSTSPARSVDTRGAPSGEKRTNDLINSVESSREGLNLSGPPPRPQRPPEENAAPRLPSSARRGPPEALRLDPAIQGGLAPSSGSPPLRSPMFPSRRDPAIQAGQGSPSLRSPSFPDRRDPAVQEGQIRSPRRPNHDRQPSRSRGNCKSCRQPISGKSISSADGRLTGRYHKACFVCATCREPFTGTTFYVLDDKPYCEHDYHTLNGSLCGSCNKGIEGQYLEDESTQKYHLDCFRCRDCGVVLRDGYFEVNGAAFCERDAMRRMQPAMRQPSTQGRPRGGPPPGMGMPSGPPQGALNRPFGLPSGQRLAPGQALGRGGLGSMPRMEKRMTRLGMMGAA